MSDDAGDIEIFDDLVPELARRQHEEYLKSVKASGEYDPNHREAHRPWEELSSEKRHGNIDQVRHSLLTKLDAAGLIAVHGIDVEGAIANLDEATVEVMAIAEHDRWCDYMRTQGWVGGEERDETNPDQRVHDLLVPWAVLTEYERDKDRDPCRRLPTDLRDLGWSIVEHPG